MPEGDDRTQSKWRGYTLYFYACKRCRKQWQKPGKPFFGCVPSIGCKKCGRTLYPTGNIPADFDP